MLKIDDDCIVYPTRLQWPAESRAYVGWAQEQFHHCAGLAYFLGYPAMRVIATADIDPDMTAEDRWVGEVLYRAGIKSEMLLHGAIQWVGRRRPLPANLKAIIGRCWIAGEFTPQEMQQVYR